MKPWRRSFDKIIEIIQELQAWLLEYVHRGTDLELELIAEDLRAIRSKYDPRIKELEKLI